MIRRVLAGVLAVLITAAIFAGCERLTGVHCHMWRYYTPRIWVCDR